MQPGITIDSIWDMYHNSTEARKVAKADISRYNLYIGPKFGNRIPTSLSTSEIDAYRSFLLEAGKNPQTVKHIFGLLRRLIRFGVQRVICPPLDPGKLHFEMPNVDNQKTEMLTDEELQRFLKALDEEPNQDAAALIRLALVTGMRKGALLGLRWDDCDFEHGQIRLRGESAKKGKTEYIPMTPAARMVLESIQDKSSDYVFPGKNGGQRKEFRRIANRVKQKAGLPEDFRPLHGLRHNFASRLASSGQVELYTLQKLLTHSSPQMTQRYAHLRDETLRKAAELADEMLFATSGNDPDPAKQRMQ